MSEDEIPLRVTQTGVAPLRKMLSSWSSYFNFFFLTGSCKLTLRNYLSWKTAWSGFKGLLRDFTGAEGKKLTVSALCTDTCRAAFTQTLALTQNPLVTYPHPHVWFPRTTFNSLNWSQLHFVISEVKIAVLHYVRLLFLKQSYSLRRRKRRSKSEEKMRRRSE